MPRIPRNQRPHSDLVDETLRLADKQPVTGPRNIIMRSRHHALRLLHQDEHELEIFHVSADHEARKHLGPEATAYFIEGHRGLPKYFLEHI